MPICVLKRGDLSSRENEARLLHQNEVKFAQAAQCKHKIGQVCGLPLSTAINYQNKVKYYKNNAIQL